MTHPIPVIFGPTAVGKTDLSLAVARRLKAEIISADSRQIYCGLDVGTAKPSPGQRQMVPHHLIDLLNPDEPLNAARFARLAWNCLRAIEARRRLPLVVGGSGLYIRALTDGLFVGPEANPSVRLALEEEARNLGLQALHDRLATVDAVAARRIHRHDQVRIIRALEIYTMTGRPISYWQHQWRNPVRPRSFVLIGLTREREDLRRRIAARTETMLQMGLVAEVQRILALGFSPMLPTLQSVGYGELVSHLAGRWDLAQARELIERHTWRLAKRQMTWFRRLTDVHWLCLTGTPESSAVQAIEELVANTSETLPESATAVWPEEPEAACRCPLSI